MREVQGPRIFVGNLPWRVDETALFEFFDERVPSGTLNGVKILRDTEGRSRGCAFLTLQPNADPEAVLRLDELMFLGRPLRVKLYEPGFKFKQSA